MSDRGSIDQWRRDRDNDPRLYDDVSSREFRERPRRAGPGYRSDDYTAQAAPQPRDRPRRKSILVDPNERAQRPRAARRNSQVRLQSSDDEGSGYIPVRRPPIGSEASHIEKDMASRHDLERKTTQAHRSFRDKRDGYESEEGETLRRQVSDDPRPRQRPGEGRGRGDPGADPRRRQQGRGADVDPRDYEPRETPVRTRAPPVQYGNMPVDPRRGGQDYLDPRADPGLRRSASHRDPRERRPPAYDYDDDDDYRPPPRRQASQRDPRREPRRDPRYDDYDDPRDNGYRSERDGRRRPGPRHDDYYSDGGHSRGYNRPPPYYEDDRYRRRDSYAGDRRARSGGRGDRYRDGYDDRDRRKSNKDWQATAATAFATYAMPMIKKEGTRFLRKQMQEFMAKQGGR